MEGRGEFFNPLKKQKLGPNPPSETHHQAARDHTVCESTFPCYENHLRKLVKGGKMYFASQLRMLYPTVASLPLSEYIMCIAAEGHGIRKPLNYGRQTRRDRDR